MFSATCTFRRSHSLALQHQLVAEIFTLTGTHVRTLSLSNAGADIFVYGLLVSVPTNSVYVCGSQRGSSYTVTISRVRFVAILLFLRSRLVSSPCMTRLVQFLECVFLHERRFDVSPTIHSHFCQISLRQALFLSGFLISIKISHSYQVSLFS